MKKILTNVMDRLIPFHFAALGVSLSMAIYGILTRATVTDIMFPLMIISMVIVDATPKLFSSKEKNEGRLLTLVLSERVAARFEEISKRLTGQGPIEVISNALSVYSLFDDSLGPDDSIYIKQNGFMTRIQLPLPKPREEPDLDKPPAEGRIRLPPGWEIIDGGKR